MEDFNAGDGGFTVTNDRAPPLSPWGYDAGSGTWRCSGFAGDGGPAWTMLTSPMFTASRSGPATLTLTHRHDFEDGLWDGGQIQISVNGGPFAAVTSFSANGYTANLVGNGILNGQPAFANKSVGHAAGTHIVSVAKLGNLSSGASVQARLVVNWDECCTGSMEPSWEVTSVSVAGPLLADSIDDWSTTGTQGERSWFNGYYNFTGDGDATYQTSDFIPFVNDGSLLCEGTAGLIGANHWTGAQWDLNCAANPWTELGRDNTHPAGDNPAHWTVRRWVSTYTGDATLRWHTRKANTGCGNGVTGRLFINGVQVDSATIAGGDGTGVTRTVVQPIAAGDLVELALDPLGTDATRLDGCDGTINRLTIETGVPDTDGDGVGDPDDNCDTTPNASQADSDGDGAGDACDNCPADANPGQEDRDRDGTGNACDMALADSIDDWSPIGQQGAKLWFNGYYNLTNDPDGTYQTSDFVPFLNDGTGVVSATNQWNGTIFDFPTNPPWTELGQEGTHPNGVNNGTEEWTIRRWVNTTFTGDVAITWHARKTNPGGTGTTGRLFLNGTLVDSATVSDTTGVVKSYYASIAPGARIDLALTPEGFGDRNDGADGSATWMRIKAKVPCGSYNLGERVADSQADWSPTGTQGEKNWHYGFYDVRDDLANGNGAYDTGDFIEFLNDGSNAVSVDPTIGGWMSHPNQWNGSAWDLLNSGVVFTGPWTELTQTGGHPAANGQGDPSVHWFVRRWVSPAEDDVLLTGSLRTAAACGDGTVGRIFKNGTQIFSARSQGNTVNISLNLSLDAGDILDFAVDPDGAGNLGTGGIDTISDGCDSTTFVVSLVRLEVFNPCPQQIAGDCNQDGALGIADVVCGVGLLFPTFVLVGTTPGLPCGGSPGDEGNLLILDVNGSGSLSSADLVHLASYLFSGGPPPTLGTGCFDITDCDANVGCD